MPEVAPARRVVNAFGSSRYHVADIPPTQLAYHRWISWFVGAPTPVSLGGLARLTVFGRRM